MYGRLSEEISRPQVFLEKELWLHTTVSLRQVAMLVLYRPSMHPTGKSHENHDCYWLSTVSLSSNAISCYASLEY